MAASVDVNMAVGSSSRPTTPIPDPFVMDDVIEFASKERLDDDYINVIWLRCIGGDKDNAIHSGQRARYPREWKLLERIVGLVNECMIDRRDAAVPENGEIEEFITSKKEAGRLDAEYVYRRCIGKTSQPLGTSPYPREKAMFRRVLDMLRALHVAIISKEFVSPVTKKMA